MGKYWLILLAGLTLALSAWAADNPVAGQEPAAQQQDAGSSQAGDNASSEETTTEEGEETDARFIPTEEISQDLGVSFPVDI